MLDFMKTREDLKENEILIDLVKALKEAEPKLMQQIQSDQVMDDPDMLAICILVNEDMQVTFKRFKVIKDGGLAEKFYPGEYT